MVGWCHNGTTVAWGTTDPIYGRSIRIWADQLGGALNARNSLHEKCSLFANILIVNSIPLSEHEIGECLGYVRNRFGAMTYRPKLTLYVVGHNRQSPAHEIQQKGPNLRSKNRSLIAHEV